MTIMAEYGTTGGRQLTESQLEALSQVEQPEVVEAFDAVLRERGIPLAVRRVEFTDLEKKLAADTISPDPSGGPPDPQHLPRGSGSGVYTCWRENGAWVCVCGNPNPGSMTSHP